MYSRFFTVSIVHTISKRMNVEIVEKLLGKKKLHDDYKKTNCQSSQTIATIKKLICGNNIERALYDIISSKIIFSFKKT